LSGLLSRGGQIKATRLSEAFDWAQYQTANPGAIPLFIMDGKGKPQIVTGPVTPQAGELLIALQPPREQGAE
ncbi:MAG: sodium:proton antiporter, partial [Aeromonas veronii]